MGSVLLLRAAIKIFRRVDNCPQHSGVHTFRGNGIEELGTALANSFKHSPTETAKVISDSLPGEQKAMLLRELSKSLPNVAQLDPVYIDRLFEHADTRSPKGFLDRTELATAIGMDRQLTSQRPPPDTSRPATSSLMLMAFASGIPFIGFGFMDNAIMLMAGEEIDVVFGATWGLSKLAAAGLGNIVADMVGVGFAEQIEEWIRKVKWARPPKLSRIQRDMVVCRVARTGGAMLGVTIGGLIGLTPLLWLDKKDEAAVDDGPSQL